MLRRAAVAACDKLGAASTVLIPHVRVTAAANNSRAQRDVFAMFLMFAVYAAHYQQCGQIASKLYSYYNCIQLLQKRVAGHHRR